MTRSLVARLELAEKRRVDVAVPLVEARAAWMEDARGRRGDRRRHVAGEDDPVAAPAAVGSGNGGEEGRRVGMLRALVDRLAVAELDDVPEIHHGDPVCDLPDHRQVVGDEDVGEVEVVDWRFRSRLRICAWIETSRAETGSSQTISFG